MTPTEALFRALERLTLHSDPRVCGGVVNRLDKETREALSRLTSDDTLNMRPDAAIGKRKAVRDGR